VYMVLMIGAPVITETVVIVYTVATVDTGRAIHTVTVGLEGGSGVGAGTLVHVRTVW